LKHSSQDITNTIGELLSWAQLKEVWAADAAFCQVYCIVIFKVFVKSPLATKSRYLLFGNKENHNRSLAHMSPPKSWENDNEDILVGQ
jgi:hypothetical protein